jgi:predicted nucleotidyltransferase
MQREACNWAAVFVFGSALTSKNPNDLDLLVVYDPEACPLEQARDKALKLASELSGEIGLQPHVVVLTESEERSVRFIQREGCIEFASWLKLRAQNSGVTSLCNP